MKADYRLWQKGKKEEKPNLTKYIQKTLMGIANNIFGIHSKNKEEAQANFEKFINGEDGDYTTSDGWAAAKKMAAYLRNKYKDSKILAK